MDTETMLAEMWKASTAITPKRRAELFQEGRKTGNPAFSKENELKPADPEFVRALNCNPFTGEPYERD